MTLGFSPPSPRPSMRKYLTIGCERQTCLVYAVVRACRGRRRKREKE
jgi:hypothetical protein